MLLIKYPLQDGKFYELDLDGDPLRVRAEWAAVELHASNYVCIPAISAYDFNVPDVPSGKVVFVSGNVIFTLPGIKDGINASAYAVDARALMISPEAIVSGISLALGIKTKSENPKFVNPLENAPKVEDWELPNSVIGPPLASKPGHFVFKYTAHNYGDVYISPSSNTYQLIKVQSSPFSTFSVWKKV